MLSSLRLLRSAIFIKTPNFRRNILTKSITRKLSHNNDLLRKVFDDEKFFKQFNVTGHHKVGLFHNDNLMNPQTLVEYSRDTLRQSKILVAQMLNDLSHTDGKLTYIRKLDQLSDGLCKVIDVAEFIRNSHPNQEWIDAAQQSHEILFEYMNQLNTNIELYNNLTTILNDTSITTNLTNEEIMVGKYLKQDFEKSGIYMDHDSRNNFVNLTQEISLIGANYSNGIHDLKSFWCEVEEYEFNQIESASLKSTIARYQLQVPFPKKTGFVYIPLVDNIPYSIMGECGYEPLRRKVWVAYHSASSDQITLLNSFVKYRAVLARMLGYKSYAHHQLQHKMAKTPENVMTFLNKIKDSLLGSNEGLIEEIKSLYKYSPDIDLDPQELTPEEVFTKVKPWDRDYFLERLTMDKYNNDFLPDIRPYLSVGTIMAGLNKLFSLIYGIELIPVATSDGETWDSDQVRKIKVYDHKHNKIMGYLYVDFWSPKVYPSHFTIVCSRKLNLDIKTEDIATAQSQVQLDETNEFQLPVISLLFNFQKAYSSTFSFGHEPSLLSLDQVETVFHEMGHAMHSMIGKTNLQNLSGTRAVTDFVELPSVLMESFAKDPRVLCKIASHYKTGELIDPEVFGLHQKRRDILHNSELYMQCKMAILDQMLHNSQIVELISTDFDNFNSTPIYHHLESKLKVFADTWSTWHGKFLHLFSYGSVYYSYLLDRAIADKVYQELFAQDPWNPKAGEKYKESILKWGGTRDPWICLADALDNPQLAAGDEKAMEIIGSISVHHS